MSPRRERKSQSLRGTNLNLFPILRELLKWRNVTLAAQHLNLTQSGVSNALARLRVQFDDELLVYTGGKMVPTEFAMRLLPKLDDMLAAAELVLMPPEFDPASNERTIRIAASDMIMLALGQGFLDRLAQYAPRTSLQFVGIQSPTRTDLEDGKLDFLILPRGVMPNSVFKEDGLERLMLTRDDFVCIARSDHPRIKDTLTVELLNQLPVVAVRSDDEKYLYTAIPGRYEQDPVQVPNFTVPPILAAYTNAVAMMPRRIAEWFSSVLPIQLHELPIPYPKVDTYLYWSNYYRNDPMHAWMREQIVDIVSGWENPWLSPPP